MYGLIKVPREEIDSGNCKLLSDVLIFFLLLIAVVAMPISTSLEKS